LGALAGAQTGALAGFEAFRAIAWINTLVGLISFPLLVLSTWAAGLDGALWGLIAGMAVNVLLNQRELHRQLRAANIRIAYARWSQEWRVLVSFSLPALLSSLLTAALNWFCTILLLHQCMDAEAQVAVLSVANQWRAVLLFLPTMLVQVALPIMSQQGKQDVKDPVVGQVYELTNCSTLLAILPASVIVMFLAEVVLALYGAEFRGQEVVLVGMLANVMVISTGTALSSTLQARGLAWTGFWINVAYTAVMLAVYYQFVPTQGAAAFGFCSAGSFLLIASIAFPLLRFALPPGAVLREFGYLGLVVGLTALALFCPLSVRAVLALPVAVLVALGLIESLFPGQLRQRLWTRRKERSDAPFYPRPVLAEFEAGKEQVRPG
jgi:O-antigen/teichoic acid export membrane protein